MTSIFFFVQCIIKQLLDSVLVISRIIKVSVKPRPNDGNMPTQHIPTFLGATFGHGHIVEMYCDMLGVVRSSLKIVKFSLSQQHPTCRNTSQTAWPNACNILRPAILQYSLRRQANARNVSFPNLFTVANSH